MRHIPLYTNNHLVLRKRSHCQLVEVRSYIIIIIYTLKGSQSRLHQPWRGYEKTGGGSGRSEEWEILCLLVL